MICGFCGSTTDVTFNGPVPRCREWRPCWNEYIRRCDEEDAAKRAAALLPSGRAGDGGEGR